MAIHCKTAYRTTLIPCANPWTGSRQFIVCATASSRYAEPFAVPPANFPPHPPSRLRLLDALARRVRRFFVFFKS
jgi:hypothetical protein